MPPANPRWFNAESGVDEQIAPARSRQPARKGDDARLAVDEERIAPLVPVRRDANGEIVAADQSRFRPPDEAALVELGEHVGELALVENEAQIPGSPFGGLQGREQGRIQLRREPVHAVGGGADPQLLEMVEAFDVVIELMPLRAVEDDDPVLGLHIGPPARTRREEPPEAEIEQGHFVLVAGESARRARADEVAVALGGRRRRKGSIALLHGQMNERIERRQGFVVGDMLLRLRGGEQRQGQMRGG